MLLSTLDTYRIMPDIDREANHRVNESTFHPGPLPQLPAKSLRPSKALKTMGVKGTPR